MNLASAILPALLAFQEPSTTVLQRIWHYVNYDYRIGNISVSLTSLVSGLLVFLFALALSRTIQSVLQRRISKRAYIDPGIQYTITRLVHYVIITLGVLYSAWAAFRLDLTSLAVVFTALSVGIGFGLQYIAADVASGFILLFERPIRVGDRVTIGDDEGDVQAISLRTTRVITNDQLAVIVPNSKLVSQMLVNWSYGDPKARIGVPVVVPVGSNVELLKESLLETVKGVEQVLETPEPSVQFVKIGETTLEFRLLVWTATPRAHVQIKSELNFRIEKMLRELPIKAPVPPREIRINLDQLQSHFAEDLSKEKASTDEEGGHLD